ncbi:MAG: hypothetical protein CL817_00010 [Croceibacter sp.]|nr:hypothetical protein [Croceibacter sp.]
MVLIEIKNFLIKQPLINILTRTSLRPNGFNLCYESVKNQSYSNIKHIISYDDDRCLEYLKGKFIKSFKVNTQVNQLKIGSRDEDGNVYSPHNLYCNELLEKVDDGWVMFLDDDDRLMNDSVISNIVCKIKEDDFKTLYLWQMRYPNGKLKPSSSQLRNKDLPINSIGSPCFLFHSSLIGDFFWDEYKRSDYRFFKKLRSVATSEIIIDEPLIQINNFGDFGKQTDLNIKQVKQLPRSFKKNVLWYLTPKYHQTIFGAYVFHSKLYKSLLKRIKNKISKIWKN